MAVLPQNYAYSDLYYFPGHSHSPLTYLDLNTDDFTSTDTDAATYQLSDDQLTPIQRRARARARERAREQEGCSNLALYALTPESGEWRLMVVILSFREGDERVGRLKKGLFPGAIVHLPSSGFTLTPYQSNFHTLSDTHNGMMASSSTRHRTSSPSPIIPNLSSQVSPLPRLATLGFSYRPAPGQRDTSDLLAGNKALVYSRLGRVLRDEEMGGKIGRFRRCVEERVWSMLGWLHVTEEMGSQGRNGQ